MLLALAVGCVKKYFPWRVPRPIWGDEDIKRLAVINEEGINWSDNLETRVIEIDDYITADEFYKIIELVLANWYVDEHSFF